MSQNTSKKLNNTKDMTEGQPVRLILEFAIPLLMGILFQQVYNMVDTMIVGKTLGVSALAAVGSTGSVCFLIMGGCMGITGGFALPIAQQFGAKDYKLLKKYAGNAVVLSAIIAVIATAATTLLCRSILTWMNTPADIMEDAFSYLFILFIGIPGSMMYNLLAGFLRSLGDSKRPLYFLIFSSFLNIGLDFLFILTFHLGVAGAAYATILAQLISGILCLFYIRRNVEMLQITRGDCALSRVCVKNLVLMGFPMGLQYSITAIGSVVLQSSVNSLGSIAVASMTTASKLDMFTQCPFGAFGNAMATYAGQNVGARKYDRVKNGLYSTTVLMTIYSLVMMLLVRIFGQYFYLLFVDKTETQVIAQAFQCNMIFLYFYVPLALVNIVRFTIQGMGYSGLAMIAGIAEMFARAIVGAVFVPLYGFTAACFAGPAAWIAADAFLIPCFYWCLAKLKSRAQQV